MQDYGGKVGEFGDGRDGFFEVFLYIHVRVFVFLVIDVLIRVG